jgi:hypothetical protein
MHIETQFSVFMINKPGILAKILDEFASAKVNIVAITMMDSVEHGVLRVVAISHEKVRKLLAKMNLQCSETDVLCVNLPNKSGALADVTGKLSKAHINISYAYCTSGARGGRTTAILKVADVKRAMKVLKVPGKTVAKKKTVKRKPTTKK